MIKQINLKQWSENFLNGKYASQDIKTQCDAGWYDWFCKDSSLKNKTVKLGKKVLQIMKTKKFDSEKVYVFFKNNCPVYGSLYDDFRICDLASGAVLFTVVPSYGYKKTKGQSCVWGKDSKGEFKGLVCGTWKDVLNFFLS